MNLAIDFNHTIHDRANPLKKKGMGPPIKGTKEAMQELCDQGNTIHVFTDMANTSDGWRTVNDWLNYYEIPFHYITNQKPKNIDFFIDDKAIRFKNWKQVMRDIVKLHGTKRSTRSQ